MSDAHLRVAVDLSSALEQLELYVSGVADVDTQYFTVCCLNIRLRAFSAALTVLEPLASV